MFSGIGGSCLQLPQRGEGRDIADMVKFRSSYLGNLSE